MLVLFLELALTPMLALVLVSAFVVVLVLKLVRVNFFRLGLHLDLHHCLRIVLRHPEMDECLAKGAKGPSRGVEAGEIRTKPPRAWRVLHISPRTALVIRHLIVTWAPWRRGLGLWLARLRLLPIFLRLPGSCL